MEGKTTQPQDATAEVEADELALSADDSPNQAAVGVEGAIAALSPGNSDSALQIGEQSVDAPVTEENTAAADDESESEADAVPDAEFEFVDLQAVIEKSNEQAQASLAGNESEADAKQTSSATKVPESGTKAEESSQELDLYLSLTQDLDFTLSKEDIESLPQTIRKQGQLESSNSEGVEMGDIEEEMEPSEAESIEQDMANEDGTSPEHPAEDEELSAIKKSEFLELEAEMDDEDEGAVGLSKEDEDDDEGEVSQEEQEVHRGTVGMNFLLRACFYPWLLVKPPTYYLWL